MVATASGVDDPSLSVQVGGQPPADLSPATRVGDAGAPEDGMTLNWHRIEVTRDQLEKDPLLEVTVGPTGPERFAPAAVGMVGGFSLRPTVRPTPSAFYDGASWSTEPPAMLPLWPGGVKGAARYYVELRVVKQAFRRQTLTTYY